MKYQEFSIDFYHVSGIRYWCNPDYYRDSARCLPFGKADHAVSPALPRICNSGLWLHPWRLGSKARSTFAMIG